MRVLVTGAAGMLGRDVLQAARAAGHEVVGLSRAELDITDAGAVAAALAASRPDVVVNCAAFTDVDGAESSPDVADAVNAGGAGTVAAAASSAGAWLVHISSDYVFDGSSTEPYVESDAVGPQSAYGRSKLGGEQAVADAAPAAHTIVRSSWLFGIGGPCFPATILRLAKQRDQLTVVEDQVGSPTFTGHLAPALIELAQQPPVGIIHVAGGGQCSWYEFAGEIVAHSDASCEVRPGTTAELGRPAPRPAYSVLATERPDVAPRLADWREGLGQFMGLAVAS